MRKEKLDRFYELIAGIDTAMFTTRRPDGHLVSRPMATQKRAEGAELWFVTPRGRAKRKELDYDRHVNLSWFKERTKEWVSAAGMARVVEERQKIRELYSGLAKQTYEGAVAKVLPAAR